MASFGIFALSKNSFLRFKDAHRSLKMIMHSDNTKTFTTDILLHLQQKQQCTSGCGLEKYFMWLGDKQFSLMKRQRT